MNRSELEAEFGRPPLEVMQKAVTVTFFIGDLSLIDVASTVLEHAIEYPSQFVGGRREGLRGTDMSFEATEVRTEGRLTLVERLCCQTQGSSGSVAEGLVRLLRRLPPETLLPGTKPSQEPKCFSVGQRLMSSPTSPMTVRAVFASMLSIWVRSTPVIR